METFALVLSWLRGLESVGVPVINPASARGIGGSPHHALAWHLMAARSGLRVPDMRWSSSTRRWPVPGSWTVARGPALPAQLVGQPAWSHEPLASSSASLVVVGEQVFGGAAADVKDACRRLAKASGAPFLRVFFIQLAGADAGAPDKRPVPGHWVFAGADPFPVVAEDEVLVALAHLLETNPMAKGIDGRAANWSQPSDA
jgi:hypothetical protein